MKKKQESFKKKRILIVYGGVCAEREVSKASAYAIAQALYPEEELFFIGIDAQGKWKDQTPFVKKDSGICFKKDFFSMLPLLKEGTEVFLKKKETFFFACEVHTGKQLFAFDLAFPVLHGPFGEDGTVQGLLETIGIPYVGEGVLSSALGMDKDMARALVSQIGVPVVPYFKVLSFQKKKLDLLWTRIDQLFGKKQVFVKPARMGSSIGVSQVLEENQLEPALKEAFRWDSKVLIEKAISAREIEVSVIQKSQTETWTSVPGEICPQESFYSYEAKYLDPQGAELLAPAPLNKKEKEKAQSLAKQIFQTLGCQHLARVDFFYDREEKVFYWNEINTFPGFTPISMFPKLCELSGISYQELLRILIRKAFDREKV